MTWACASFHIQFIIPFQINCWNNILNIIFTTNMSWLMSALFISILFSPRSHFYTLWKRQKKVLQLLCIILLSYRVLKSREAQNLVEFQSWISKNWLFQPYVDFLIIVDYTGISQKMNLEHKYNKSQQTYWYEVAFDTSTWNNVIKFDAIVVSFFKWRETSEICRSTLTLPARPRTKRKVTYVLFSHFFVVPEKVLWRPS